MTGIGCEGMGNGRALNLKICLKYPFKTNRVHISQLRGRKRPSPQSSTEPEAIRQELGNLFLKGTDAEDSTSKGGFGARQTTTDNDIEDD